MKNNLYNLNAKVSSKRGVLVLLTLMSTPKRSIQILKHIQVFIINGHIALLIIKRR